MEPIGLLGIACHDPMTTSTFRLVTLKDPERNRLILTGVQGERTCTLDARNP